MIKRRLIGKLIAAISVAACTVHVHAKDDFPAVVPAQGTLQAAFAPWDDVEKTITSSIDEAKRQVLVHAYLLTNKKITNALLSAKRRGLDVKVLADARKHAEMPSSRLAELAAGGVGVWIEQKYENAHNKVIIIDAATADATVITGSFNFTWTAQHRNAENILVARKNPLLAARYEMNWLRHQQQATLFAQ